MPEDHKRFTLVCLHCRRCCCRHVPGPLFCIRHRALRHLLVRQSCRHTNLKVCLARDPVGDLHCLARPSFGETERAAIEDLAELMREARMRRIRMGVALAVVVIPFLLLMTAVLPRMLSFTSTGISTEMSPPSIDEFDEACMKTINVRVAGVVLHFYPYTLFFYGLLEFIAVTTVTAASNQSFGHFLSQQLQSGWTKGELLRPMILPARFQPAWRHSHGASRCSSDIVQLCTWWYVWSVGLHAAGEETP